MVRNSLIPEHNLRKLKESFDTKTIASVIAKHLKNFIRRRIIEESISNQALKNIRTPFKHLR